MSKASGNVVHVDFTPQEVEVDTEEVVALSKRAAALLGRHIGRVVRISHTPFSAGAFVCGGDLRLGITVGLYSTLRGPKPEDEDTREWVARRAAAPKYLGVDVTADVEWLVDQSLATEGDFGGEHAFADVPSVEAAILWIKENCYGEPKERVSPAELDEWSKRKVTVADFDNPSKRKVITFNKAVSTFGPLYRYEISQSVLIREHLLSVRDARDVVDAVRKILPKILDTSKNSVTFTP